MPHEIPRQPSDGERKGYTVFKYSITQSITERVPWPYSGPEGEPWLLFIQWMSLQWSEDDISIATGITTDGCLARAYIDEHAKDIRLEVEPKQADGETSTPQSS